jgi:hypothetical protein
MPSRDELVQAATQCIPPPPTGVFAWLSGSSSSDIDHGELISALVSAIYPLLRDRDTHRAPADKRDGYGPGISGARMQMCDQFKLALAREAALVDALMDQHALPRPSPPSSPHSDL